METLILQKQSHDLVFVVGNSDSPEFTVRARSKENYFSSSAAWSGLAAGEVRIRKAEGEDREGNEGERGREAQKPFYN